MKKLPVIVDESLNAVMDEVSKEVTKVLAETPSKEDRVALNTFLGTMTYMMVGISYDLPIEDQEDALTVCGAWFEVGMLFGRSPQLLVDILQRARPKIGGFTPPEWFMEKDEAISEVEYILRREPR